MPGAEDAECSNDDDGKCRPADLLVVDRAEHEGEGGNHTNAEQQSGQDVRHPVGAKVDTRKADGNDQCRGDGENAGLGPTAEIVGDQHGANAVEHRVQRRMATGETVGVGTRIKFDRPRAMQHQLEQGHEHGGAGHRDDEADAAPPGFPQEQIGGNRNGDGGNDDPVAERCHEHHDPVADRRAQAVEQVQDGKVGPHHRFAGGDFSDDPEEGRQGNQQDQRGGQHACRAWMRGVEIARDPLGYPVLTPGEAFDDGRMGVGKQRQDNQDQPAAEHHRQEDDDQESAEHQGQPSADLADGIKCGTCNDTGGDMHDRPGEGGGDVDHRKAGEIHAGHAGDAWNHRFYTRHEAADKDALAAVFLEEILAAFHNVRIFVQRPHGLDLVLEGVADPVGDRIACGRSQGRPDEQRHGIQLAEPDKRSGAHQHHRRRHEKADQEQRFAHGGQKTDQTCQGRVFRDEGQNRIKKFGHGVGRVGREK